MGYRKFANRTFANWTFAIGERPLYFRQYTSCTVANWRMSTILSPVYPLNSRQLANVHYTFASIPFEQSPIGECPLNIRQCTL